MGKKRSKTVAAVSYPEHLINLQDMMDFIYEDGFFDDWEELGLDEEEDLPALECAITGQPNLGDVIPGAEGLRKLRWAIKGSGKRGGARLIYMYIPEIFIVYVFLAYKKSEMDDLSQETITELASYAKGIRRRLVELYGKQGI